MQVKLRTLALAAIVAAAPIFGSKGTGSFSDQQSHVDGALYARSDATVPPLALAAADSRIVDSLR